MKKVLIISILLFFCFSFLFSEETVVRKNVFGINPLGLLFKIYAGEYGRIINNGANEINIPFFYWHPINNSNEDLSLMGIGARYRFYKHKNGKGPFYGPTVSVAKVSWEIDDDKVDAVAFSPGAEIGYRWAWDNGFTLAPTIGASYSFGKVETNDGVEADFASSGFAFSLGLGLAIMW